MADRRVVTVYSRALYGLARERGVTELVARQLHAFAQAVGTVPELQALWVRMRLPVKDKTAVLDTVLPAGFTPLTRHFLAVLIRRRRESYLAAVIDRFTMLIRRDRGRVRVRVASAVSLTAPLRARVEALVARLTGLRADAEYTVDPDLLGGFVLRVGDYLVDAGLRGRLERMRMVFGAGSEVTGYGSSS